MNMSLCPVCGTGSFEPFIDFGEVPKTSSLLRSGKQKIDMIQLAFDFCVNCSVIRRCSQSYDISNYSDFMPIVWRRPAPYTESIIIPFLEKDNISRDGLIVDIGANDGEFLDKLKDHGYTNLVGVEPSELCCEVLESKGYQSECLHLNEKTAEHILAEYGGADVVFCRHTLEHVEHPDEFVLALGKLLSSDGLLMIEVPDAIAISEKLRGYLLREEHLYNFFHDGLVYLFERLGFEVTRTALEVGGGDEVILLWARLKKSSGGGSSEYVCTGPEVSQCYSFSDRWNKYSARLLEQAEQWPKPIVSIGASYKQANLLNFTGLGRHVSMLVDDASGKVGRYVSIPQPVKVISSNQFSDKAKNEEVGTIVRSAFGYDEWMDRVCDSVSGEGVLVVDPYGKVTMNGGLSEKAALNFTG